MFPTTLSRAVLQAFETSWDANGPEARSRWEARTENQDVRIRFTWRNIKASDETFEGLQRVVGADAVLDREEVESLFA